MYDEGSNKHCNTLWRNIKMMEESFGIIHNSRNSRILLFSALVDFKVYLFLLRMEILLIGRMTIGQGIVY